MNHPTLMSQLATTRVDELRASARSAGWARAARPPGEPRGRRRAMRLRPAFGR
jgi:hypothetical protein